jgi:hypothetical protein
MYQAACSCGSTDGRWFRGGKTGPNKLVTEQTKGYWNRHMRATFRDTTVAWPGVRAFCIENVLSVGTRCLTFEGFRSTPKNHYGPRSTEVVAIDRLSLVTG